MIYGTDKDKFELYNNPWEIIWIILGCVIGAIILIVIAKYKLIDYM